MPRHSWIICCVAAVVALGSQGVAAAAIVELGDLNIIDDPGNPSDGLRYLEMTYSDGLTQAAALANAQATYSNARLAAPSEFDDLFAAAGIGYSGATTASDGFEVGASVAISYDSDDIAALASALGYTYADRTYMYTDPDGDHATDSTRDGVELWSTAAYVAQYGSGPPNDYRGWLLVSDAPVPEPSTLAALSGLLVMGLIGRWWRRKKAA